MLRRRSNHPGDKELPVPTILITGAGRGLGLALVHRFAELGWETLGTVRDPAQRDALPRGSRAFTCDVTQRDDLARLARELEGRAVDVLFCNAGLFGTRQQTVGHVDYALWAEVMRVNVFAPMACVEALVDHVAASARRQIVMMSSRLGSITENSGGEVVYRSSKAALNAVTRSLAADLAPRGITLAAVHPGWVQTDMGGPRAPLTPAESARDVSKVVLELTPEKSGRFFNYDGTEIPW
jgi:NAD(P)-dependent dehydrogenase (short-subunit alcohol dehydrogenase family)